mgnify:CR=1 FL=1
MWNFMYELYQQPMWMLSLFSLLVIWEVAWKGLALWHSAKNKQMAWFVVLLLFNTLGLLPIIYLVWFRPKEENGSVVESVEVKAKETKKNPATKKSRKKR